MTTASSEFASEPAPIWSATLWPHRSLSPRGFRWLIALVIVGLLIPLAPILGSAAAWVIGAFLAADLALLYGMMQLSYRSGRVRETIELWPDRLRVEREEPNGARKTWEANPHWVRVQLIPTRNIEDYLVLSSGGKDIELGAFLTPGERRDLADQLRGALNDAAGQRSANQV